MSPPYWICYHMEALEGRIGRGNLGIFLSVTRVNILTPKIVVLALVYRSEICRGYVGFFFFFEKKNFMGEEYKGGMLCYGVRNIIGFLGHRGPVGGNYIRLSVGNNRGWKEPPPQNRRFIRGWEKIFCI